jgi:NTE family protein
MCHALRSGCLALLLAAGVAAQTAPPNPRKKIGVAFAGGAAMGFAHIGVLQWFEEHHIPVDHIAGTSMGGLVAALYATGHSPAEITAFAKDIDWNQALAVDAPYRQLAFRRKEDAREFPTKLELGFKKGISLPSGLSPGEGVGIIISRFAAPYENMKSFDDLPTPFRCVATDLLTANEVIFDKGSLFDALRATMSLPALFSPVNQNNMVLVDGGLVNNLPVDVVKAMGADVVIAVALNKPPDPSEVKSLLGVASRSVSVMITDNERRNMGLATHILMPDLKNFGTNDYPRYLEISKSGYESVTADKADLLDRYALNDTEWSAYLKQRQDRRRPESISPQFVEIAGQIAPKRGAALEAALKVPPGQPLNRDVVEDQMIKLTGMGRYATADYSFVQRDSQYGLRVQVKEKTWGPPFLKVGLLIDGNPDDGLRFGASARLIFLDLGGPASEWRSDFSVGVVNRLSTEYYYRIRGGKWFLAPRLYYNRDTFPLYEGSTRLLEYRDRTYGAGGDVGYAFGRFQEFRFGYDVGNRNLKVLTGEEPVTLNGRFAAFNVHWTLDHLDSALVPLHGFRTELTAKWYTTYAGVSEDLPLVRGLVSYAHPIAGRYSMIWNAMAGATTDRYQAELEFQQGGLFQLSSLARGQYLGTRGYRSGLYALRSISNQDPSLFGRFYIGLGWEIGKSWASGGSAIPYNDGLLGLYGETPLGLLFFGGAIGEHGDRKILFRLGRIF